MSDHYLEPEHLALRAQARAAAAARLAAEPPPHETADEVDARTRALARWLGEAGLAAEVVPAAYGGARAAVSSRALCVVREELAARDGLADFAFAMQGLGSYPVTLAGSDAQRRALLPPVARGDTLCAFDGEKHLISNAGVATLYVVFAVTDPAAGKRGLSAFVVHPDDPGFRVAARQEAMSPHPLGVLRFDACRLPAGRLLGAPGDGLRLALATLEVFRPTVGAAAVGMARRALDEAVAHVKSRAQFGAPLAALQGVQFLLADSAVDLEASRLLVLRAARARDLAAPGERHELWSAAAKLHATEAASRVIDRAVQLHGGAGVLRGAVVERLYREHRALRIYEGASEVQRAVIARALLK
jgi:acyl-CoA dehydrogenase